MSILHYIKLTCTGIIYNKNFICNTCSLSRIQEIIMKLEPIQDLSCWLPAIGETTSRYQNDVHVIVGDYILPVNPIILSHRSKVFRERIQKTSDLVCSEFKRHEYEFHQCFQVLYGAEVPVTPANACVLFKFAHLYKVPEMASQVEGWITSDLQHKDFVATLISFGDYASIAFDEFEKSARGWLENTLDHFMTLNPAEVSKFNERGLEIVISFLISRLAKDYFTSVARFIITVLDLNRTSSITQFVLLTYKNFVMSRDFWKYNFDKFIFSELCSRFNEGLDRKEDFVTLVDIAKITGARLTENDYNNLSLNLVKKLSAKETTIDQMVYFMKNSTLKSPIIFDIVTHWIPSQDDDTALQMADIVKDDFRFRNEYYSKLLNVTLNITDGHQLFDQPNIFAYGSKRVIYLFGNNKPINIFDHRPTLEELSANEYLRNYGFKIKPGSIPQYETLPRQCHWILVYLIDNREHIYSFITGEMSELMDIFREASSCLVLGGI